MTIERDYILPTVLTAHQPLYIPWLGFFQKVSMSDIFCILDDVQFSTNDFTHRNKIKSARGPLIITIPILRSGHFEKKIMDMEIDNKIKWERIHWNSILASYGKKAPYFECYKDFFETTYKKSWDRIVDLDLSLLEYLFKEMGISVKIVKSSEMKIQSDKSEKLIEICQNQAADIYISGECGKNYVDNDNFNKNGINLYFQDYQHPVYSQLYGEFISHLSVIDLLFNHGEKSYAILTTNNPKKEDLIKKFAIVRSDENSHNRSPSR